MTRLLTITVGLTLVSLSLLTWAEEATNIAGVTPQQACTFLKTLQRTIAKHQPQQLAALIAYPIRYPGCVDTTDHTCPKITSATALLKNYEHFIRPAAKSAILKQSCADLFYNYQGVMIGNGEVWFGPVGTDDNSIKIIAIN